MPNAALLTLKTVLRDQQENARNTTLQMSTKPQSNI